MPGQSGLKLNAMSMPELLKLRERIEAALASKREELQRQIDELSMMDVARTGNLRMGSRGRRFRVSARSRRGDGKANPLKGRPVAPKYRDPTTPRRLGREEDRHLAGLLLTSNRVASGTSS